MTTIFETMQIGETVNLGQNDTYVVKTGENKWSVCQNGEEVICHTVAEATRIVIENEVSDEAIEAWHNSELAPDLAQLFAEIGIDGTEVQIWGTRNGYPDSSLEVIVSL